MKRSVVYLGASVILFILSLMIGFWTIRETNVSKAQNTMDENVYVVKTSEENRTVEAVQTDSSKDKTTPHTRLTLKKYYKECGHTINEYAEIPEELVNKTEDEIGEIYNEWQIEQFSIEELVLVKEVEGLCNEHYVLKEKDGIIAVYKIGEDGEETLKEETGIAVEYLTEEDIQKLKLGIKVYGEENLNSIIEDYE